MFNNKNCTIMKKEFILKFDLMIFKQPTYYGYNAKIGPYLTTSISNAYVFKNLNMLKKDAPNLAKYFFAYPIKYIILYRTI